MTGCGLLVSVSECSVLPLSRNEAQTRHDLTDPAPGTVRLAFNQDLKAILPSILWRTWPAVRGSATCAKQARPCP